MSCPGLLKLYLQTSVESIPAVTCRSSEQFQKMAVAANPLSNQGGSSPDTAVYYKPCWMFPTRAQTDLQAFPQLLKNESSANSSDQSWQNPIQLQKVKLLCN